MAAITGTFTGTGSSAAIAAGEVRFSLAFAGAATVNAQWALDGVNFTTITAYTASTEQVVDTGGVPFRLNCSAFTNNVTYVIATR